MPQPHLRQQSGLNDMPLLQQHIILKQLQELQRQQQLQQLGDVRQHNSANQLPMVTRQAAGGQFPPLFNGTPIHDTSPIFMNWMQRSASPAQGASNGLVFSQEQGQVLHSSGQSPQQSDASLYGTPIVSGRGNLNQCSYLQGTPYDSAISWTKTSASQAQKPIMQLSTLSNSFLVDQCSLSQQQVCLTDGAFISKRGLQGKNFFEQVPLQSLNNGISSEKFELGNTIQRNVLAQEFNGRQEQSGLSGLLPDKCTQMDSSQGLVTLDPMEQKILFNMDDNMWDASFGRLTHEGTGSFGNTLEHSDHMNLFPQSGSYSALMQSAVAEASSSDTGLQEEWSGLTFQNTELSPDNQPSNFIDSGKQQAGWVDNNVQSVSSLCSKPSPMFSDSNNRSSFLGFQQSDDRFPLEHGEKLRQDFSHDSIRQSPKNNGNWLECNPQQKSPVEENPQVQPLGPLENAWGSHTYEHTESDAHLQSISSYNNSTQPFIKLKDMKMGSLTPCGNTTRNIHNHANALDSCWMGNIGKTIHKEREFDGCMWKADGNCGNSFSNSFAGLEQGQSGTDTTPDNREDSFVKNFIPTSNSSTTKASQETRQQVPDRPEFGHIEHVDISVKLKGNENVGENRLSNGPQILGHSYKCTGEVFEDQQNCYEKKNTHGDSHNSNSSQYTITGREVRENVWLNASDSQPLTGANQKFSGQVRIEQVSHGLRSQEQAHSAQFNSVGNASNSAVGLEKGQLTDFHGTSANAETRVDQSSEGSIVTSFLTQVPGARHPDAPVAQLYNQSYASQNSGLRLAPPLQCLPNSNGFFPSLGSLQIENTVSAFAPGAPNMRTQLPRQMPNSPLACQSPRLTISHGPTSRIPPFNLAHSQDIPQPICTNPFGHQFPILEAAPFSQLPFMSWIPQQAGISVRPPSVWTNVSTQHLSATEPHRVPSRDISNISVEITSRAPQVLDDQNFHKGGNGSLGFAASSMNSQGFEHGEEQPGNERSQHQTFSETLNSTSQTSNFVMEKETLAKHVSDSEAPAPCSLLDSLHPPDFDGVRHGGNQGASVPKRDFDAFGRLLKPSHVFHQNYSLLHQVEAMNDMETFQNKNAVNPCNETDFDVDVQQSIAMTGQEPLKQHHVRIGDSIYNDTSAASRLNSFPSGDTNVHALMLGGRADQTVKELSQPVHQNLPSQEMATLGRTDSQSHSGNAEAVSNHIETSRISMQMAPSWFKQYGAFKNGQMLPMYDPRIAKSTSEQLSLRKPSESSHVHSSLELVNAADAGQVDSARPNATAFLGGSEHFPTTCNMPSNATGQSLAVVRLKKRKTATSELLPWNKEVSQGSQTLQKISMAEQDWAQVTNRRVEKLQSEYGAGIIEDGQQPKRRLIMTTQLMQQLLRPAPATIFSEDATSSHDHMAYSIAKLALGDACSLTSCIRSDSYCAMSSERNKTSEKIDYLYFSKVVEDFTDRARKLENDLSRLDKMAPILDIRLECQELEKYSVINRFAKFYNRVQTDATDTSSSSSMVVASPKAFLQKYIVALPMPRKLPEQIQCLSL